MLLDLENIFIIAAIFLLNTGLGFCACGRAEYKINGECCPMCPPGSHVYRDCTELVSTTCVPCSNSSFTSEPNGLRKCLPCAFCDSGQGLRVKIACRWTSNTVCEPLEGFYCINDDDEGSCTQAVKNMTCSPGQYIKHKGTADKDTECAACKNGTYSDGSVEICKQHTKCQDLGLTEIKPGTTTYDVECGKTINVALICGITAAVTVVLVPGLLMVVKYRYKIGICKDRNPGIETYLEDTEFPTPTTVTAFLPSGSKMVESTQPFWSC